MFVNLSRRKRRVVRYLEYLDQIKHDLDLHINLEKAEYFPKFFNTKPGGYGEGDQFLGITVPDQRKVAKKYYKSIPIESIQSLLRESIHEYRFTALIMLIYKFEKAKEKEEKKTIVDIYLQNISCVNNWDLVDLSADKILGAYCMDKNKDILYQLASSNHLWSQRIAIISTFYFIRKHEFLDTLEIAKVLLHHEHDLIHKAVGWMLREIGKRDYLTELEFLKQHYKTMPRTMLRYAIEKFEPAIREKFLKGLI